ncbi:hypothetical protein ABT173_39950 [Streptomyces sp. NPDC001795]|uniref:hypothetical protein n=1 Tax=unclassified Streptomyces TaxID=2593676 RepID=UPI00332CAFBA
MAHTSDDPDPDQELLELLESTPKDPATQRLLQQFADQTKGPRRQSPLWWGIKYKAKRIAASNRRRFGPGGKVLEVVAQLLPEGERAEWLEEQRGYLADLPRCRARWAWTTAQVITMPRYAYTVRTGRTEEPV